MLLATLIGCRVGGGSGGEEGPGDTPDNPSGGWVEVASGEVTPFKGDAVGGDGNCDEVRVYFPAGPLVDTLYPLSEAFDMGDSIRFYIRYISGTDTIGKAFVLLFGDDAPPNDSQYVATASTLIETSLYKSGDEAESRTAIVNNEGGPFDHYALMVSFDTLTCAVGGRDSARVYYEILKK